MNDLPEKKKGPGCFFYGCLGGVVLLVLAIVGTYFGAKKVMRVTADELYEEMSEDLAEQDLSDEERAQADALLVQLRDGVRSGEIGITDVPKLFEAIEGSALKEYGAVMVGNGIINSSDELSAEEKADGELQMSRFADGMSKGRFSDKDLEDVLDTLDGQQGGVRVKIGDEPTADEIRAMIERLRSMSDEAGLGQEGLEIDIVAELQALVDSVIPSE